MRHTRKLSRQPIMADEKGSSNPPVDVMFIIDILEAVILKKTAILGDS